MTLDLPPSAHEGRLGIIDIGSNSIRLVVYDQLKRAPIAICNEKAVCSLGKGLASSGMLNPEGVVLAREAVRRFLAMARNMDVMELQIIATAAVRDARDGQAFADELEREHHIDVITISGRKEAKLGAYGVLSSIYKPKGITGDLGGGSMEFVLLDDTRILEQVTLPIGPLRLIDEAKGDRDKIRRAVEKQLKSVDWIKDKKQPNFYAIGGSFRAIAKLYQTQVDYPLRIVHQFGVPCRDFLSFLKQFLLLSDEAIATLPGVASKRVPMLAAAAIVLDELLNYARFEHMVFSASGIREGLLYEKLSPYVREQDALLASAGDLATQNSRSLAYGNELFVWMYPLFISESEELRRLRLAFCLLSEIAWNVHPEYRSPGAFKRILISSLTALSHSERVTLALALYHRHQFKLKEEIAELALLSEKQKLLARVLGTAANLAYQLSGGLSGNLHKTTLVAQKNQVVLTLSPAVEDVMGDTVRKRVEGLNEVFRAWQKE